MRYPKLYNSKILCTLYIQYPDGTVEYYYAPKDLPQHKQGWRESAFTGESLKENKGMFDYLGAIR